MTRVVPSQVVTLIDSLFPGIGAKPDEHHRFGSEYADRMRTIVRLVDSIPSELLQISGDDYSRLVVGTASLEHIVQVWLSQGNVDVSQTIMGRHPIVLVRQALEKCPDQSPAPSTTELTFIQDSALQSDIRSDIGAAHSGLHNGNWKGATVLAGAAAEALLLWGIQRLVKDEKRDEILYSLISNGKISKPKSNKPEDWSFDHYIEVALALRIIDADTAVQARLAKDYRNLIHPGRVYRLSRMCDRATALSAMAAVEHIIRNLKNFYR